VRNKVVWLKKNMKEMKKEIKRWVKISKKLLEMNLIIFKLISHLYGLYQTKNTHFYSPKIVPMLKIDTTLIFETLFMIWRT